MDRIYHALRDYSINNQKNIYRYKNKDVHQYTETIRIWPNFNTNVCCNFIRDIGSSSNGYDSNYYWKKSGTFTLTIGDIYTSIRLMESRNVECIITQMTDLLIKKKL